MLDRIDIRHHMSAVNRVLTDVVADPPESSAAVLVRVMEARERQHRRLQGTPFRTNGEVPGSYLRRELPLPKDLGVLNLALERGQLSMRGVDKVLKVAWTLADLMGIDVPGAREVRVALHLRQGDLVAASA